MIPPDDERDDVELRALFDASVQEPSAPILTKLSAKAVDVPEHSSRTPRWLPRWTWAPGFAGLAVALGALAVTLSGWLAAPASDTDGAHAASGVTLKAAPIVGLPAAPNTPGRIERSRGPASNNAVARGEEVDGFDNETSESIVASLPVDLIAGMGSDWDPEATLGSEAEFDALDDPTAEADLDAWLYATGEVLEGG